MQVSTILKIKDDALLYRTLDKFTLVESNFQIKSRDTITYTEDGTVLQLYYYPPEAEWRTSTKNVADARQSKFSAEESFDELFWDVFPSQCLDNLDKACTYIFILKHIKNRIVLYYNENSLVFLAKIDTTTGASLEPEDDLVSSPQITREVAALLNAKSPLEESSNDLYRGILIKRLEEGNEGPIMKYYMYDFEKYTYIKNIRGNTPDILYRFIVLMQNKNPKKVFTLLKHYPEFSKDFGRLNKKLYELCIDIHNTYRCGKSIHKSHMYSGIIHLLYKYHGNNAELEDIFPIFYTRHPSLLYKLYCK